MIRAFDGSLADAEGLLAVEQATFNECPYTAQEVRAMLQPGSSRVPRPEGVPPASGGPQRAWLAIDDNPAGAHGRAPLRENVAGFVIAFPVSSLQGAWWEIDLLAVHPERQGQGLGRQLIQAAATAGEGLAGRSRAVVATDNRHSARAFVRAGFQAEPSTCTLLIRRFEEQAPWPQPAPGVSVHEVATAADDSPRRFPPSRRSPPAEGGDEGHAGPHAPRADSAGNRGGLATGDRSRAEWEAAAWQVPPPACGSPGLTLLLAEQHGRPAGHAELIEVETLLYHGIWIESLAASSRTLRETLVYQAMYRAMAAGLDEVSAMVPRQNQPLRHTLLAAGFRSLGAYRWFTADLPLSDL